jgi:hypothetical protein
MAFSAKGILRELPNLNATGRQAARKKAEDLLGNNINHPNGFGHWIYYRVLSAIGL